VSRAGANPANSSGMYMNIAIPKEIKMREGRTAD
jgi:hypothetical protein